MAHELPFYVPWILLLPAIGAVVQQVLGKRLPRQGDFVVVLTMAGARSFRDQGSNSSYGRRERGVISTDSVGRFRDVLSPSQTHFIEHAAGRAMTSLGYQPDDRPLGPLRRARFVVGDLPLEYARLLAWRARAARQDRRGRPLPSYRLVAPVSPA